MTPFYSNDAVVAEITKSLVDSGIRVFQIFQRGSERDHARYLLEQFNPPSGTVLDAGCGVGEVARLMRESRPDLDFILMNISESQLSMCPPFRKILGSIEEIPLPDNSVDSVMACYVMGHVDQSRAMAELRRVLRAGGVLFIVDITGGELPELEYNARDIGGITPNGMDTVAFDRVMPDFITRFPNIKPTILREVKCAH